MLVGMQQKLCCAEACELVPCASLDEQKSAATCRTICASQHCVAPTEVTCSAHVPVHVQPHLVLHPHKCKHKVMVSADRYTS